MLQNSFRNIFFDKVFVLYVLDRSGDALSSIPCNSILKTILSISIREIRYKSGKCDLGKVKPSFKIGNLAFQNRNERKERKENSFTPQEGLDANAEFVQELASFPIL